MATSCSDKAQLDPINYLSWFEKPDNGYIMVDYFGDIAITVFAKTADFQACKELVYSGEVIDSLKLNNKRKEIGELLQFEIRLFPKGQPYKGDYFNSRAILDQLRGELQNIVWLEEKGKRINSVLYHLEDGHGLKKEYSLMVGFDVLWSQGIVLAFDDMITGHGVIRFKFNPKKEIPTLKFDRK